MPKETSLPRPAWLPAQPLPQRHHTRSPPHRNAQQGSRSGRGGYPSQPQGTQLGRSDSSWAADSGQAPRPAEHRPSGARLKQLGSALGPKAGTHVLGKFSRCSRHQHQARVSRSDIPEASDSPVRACGPRDGSGAIPKRWHLASSHGSRAVAQYGDSLARGAGRTPA